MNQALLSINIGSSSLKFALHRADAPPLHGTCVGRGAVTGVGGEGHLLITNGSGQLVLEQDVALDSHIAALNSILDLLKKNFAQHELIGIGHRVVHGGPHYSGPVRIDGRVITNLRELIPFAPLHQPVALDAIDFISAQQPGLPQVACFDTAFHATMPKPATEFALPRLLREQGLRRYGFHGLSYQYIAGELHHICGADVASGRVIIAHLGSGASLCALQKGRSVATTMGLTPLDGLPMGRRSGSLDPGLLLYLLTKNSASAEQLSQQLYTESGLLGLSEISDDLRTLLACDDSAAREAVDYFVYWLGRHLGSLTAALDGLDAVVFTGGIGEHLPEIRERICQKASWLGLAVDARENQTGGPRISPAGAKASVWVIPTDENLVVASQTFRILRQSHPA